MKASGILLLVALMLLPTVVSAQSMHRKRERDALTPRRIRGCGAGVQHDAGAIARQLLVPADELRPVRQPAVLAELEAEVLARRREMLRRGRPSTPGSRQAERSHCF